MLKKHVIHERSEIIPIKQNLPTIMKDLSPKGEYSLKQNFFDPFKSSPPNDFMAKLQKRMLLYNSNVYKVNNDDSCDNE
jgi:hypothetical protein